jgi:hypothetical protein
MVNAPVCVFSYARYHSLAQLQCETIPAMKSLWLFALLLLICTRLSAQKSEFPQTSGNAFVRLCSAAESDYVKTEDAKNVMECVGYVSGFTNGVEYEAAYAKSLTNRKPPAPFCLPEDVENGQLIRVILKYIRDNPAVAHLPTGALIVDALGKVYPCPR